MIPDKPEPQKYNWLLTVRVGDNPPHNEFLIAYEELTPTDVLPLCGARSVILSAIRLGKYIDRETFVK